MTSIPLPMPKRTDIHRIPPEILREIFAHCPPRLVDSAYQSAPQILSSVCRLWRAVALVTPALWASLDITCNPSVLRPSLPAIHTHLQRSQTHPLSFILRADDSNYVFQTNPNILPVLTALAATRRRWRNVDIKLIQMTQDIFDFIMLGDAPLLESIQYHSPHTRFQTLPIPLRMLDHCPRLESFQWYNFGSPLLLPLVDTPLTSVSLYSLLTTSECMTLLRLSPRLCSAEFHDFHPSDPPPIPHLIHSTLRTLTATGGHCTTFLAALTLPSLLNLDLRIYSSAASLPTAWEITLSAFIERSNSTLQQLSLSTDMRSPEPALLRILALTPHLRSLRLSNTPPFSDALVHALHPHPLPGIPLCPHLRRLELSPVLNCPDGVCTAMLRARRGPQAHANGVACLESANIKLLDRGVHDRDKAEMKELYAEGMQGEIAYLPLMA